MKIVISGTRTRCIQIISCCLLFSRCRRLLQGYKIAAAQKDTSGGDRCRCGNEYDDRNILDTAPHNRCVMHCKNDNTEFCGGENDVLVAHTGQYHIHSIS